MTTGLQWGRTREGAEGALRLRCLPRLLRFSGAAPVKVRKAVNSTPGSLAILWLQWGRTREGAEGAAT